MRTSFHGRACARPRLAAFASLMALAVAHAASAQSTAGSVVSAATQSLALGEALSKALAADPSLAAFQDRIAAGDANTRQAAVRLNPVIGLELENFVGTGAFGLADRTESTLSYQQQIERGGKRQARVEVARASTAVLRRQQQVRRLDLLRDVQVAYAEAVAAEAELLIAEARLQAAQSAQRDVDRRVESARDPLFAGSRAQAETAQAQIDRDQAQTSATITRAALARFWGGGSGINLDLESFFTAASPSEAPPSAAQTDLALLEAQRDVAIAAVRVEHSRAVQDPVLRAGVRHFGDGNDVALVVGGSVPLRVNDANRGAIDRAIAERNAAEADIVAERTIREREIARLTARLSAFANESERIRAEVIPSAIRAVQQVREGFNRGGFQYLNVAEAERALYDARARRVAVLKQFHLDQAALDRLTGRHEALAFSNTSLRGQ